MSLNNTLQNVKDKKFIVEIFGLGYVGFPLAIKLASSGYEVNGIDVNSKRIERLKNNSLMDSELYLKNEFLQYHNKNLNLLKSPASSEKSKIGIICVPTPIPGKEIPSDIFVMSAVEDFLNNSKNGDMMILESSIEVGTTEKIAEKINSKGYELGKNFGLCFCPERIDPANKEWKIENIPRVIYCSDDTTYDISKEIYANVNGGNLIRVSHPKVAEIVKSFENTFRLVNISLVNELAILCDKLGINVKEVIDAAATKPFGFMPHYAGAGAGGHCIPKDPRFLLESSKKNEVSFGTIENALKINEKMPVYICDSIENSLGKLDLEKSVLVCGLSYKANVEDMRDSASFKIINELTKRNFVVYGFDPYFKKEYEDKYLIENNLKKLNFQRIDELSDDNLKKISCICIVQHHDNIKDSLNKIYESSKVPLIYDCQNKLSINNNSKTILSSLG